MSIRNSVEGLDILFENKIISQDVVATTTKDNCCKYQESFEPHVSIFDLKFKKFNSLFLNVNQK